MITVFLIGMRKAQALELIAKVFASVIRFLLQGMMYHAVSACPPWNPCVMLPPDPTLLTVGPVRFRAIRVVSRDESGLDPSVYSAVSFVSLPQLSPMARSCKIYTQCSSHLQRHIIASTTTIFHTIFRVYLCMTDSSKAMRFLSMGHAVWNLMLVR